jgi:hypothetical protein
MGSGIATRRRPAGRRLSLFCLCGVMIALALPAVSRAGLAPVDLSADPWFVGWSSLLPPLYMGVNTDSSDICVSGSIKCVNRTGQRLERQLTKLGCNPNAIFSLAYARMTEKVEAVERSQPKFFSDNPWLNHYDGTFADFYFNAWNSWQKTGTAPPAWQLAFKTADSKGASAAGNLLLGVNAHVNRDLPFTLYAIGLVAPNRTSRKPDHDAVNKILDMVITPLLNEIAAKYDPNVRVVPGLPESLDDFLEFQAIPLWREQAWRNAELLASAPNAAARAAIATTIDATAYAEGQAMLALTRYLPPLTTSASRDAYCSTHLG